MNNSVHKNYIPHRKIELYGNNSIKLKKADLPKYSKPPYVAKALPKSIKDLVNWKNHE